ncbi:MAG: hypothetical protein D6704_13525 [Nitrospirae bacterium]|nr:MAG: hypothetical protein D6704_13525 [Nitrospirota bacterium]
MSAGIARWLSRVSVIACFCIGWWGTAPLCAEQVFYSGFEEQVDSLWTPFVTPNGTIGEQDRPKRIRFDTTGNEQPSWCLRFQVGHRIAGKMPDSRQGGGIYRTFSVTRGRYEISVDVASAYASPKHRRNMDGGVFELLVDGKILDQVVIGPIETGTVKRRTLHSTLNLDAGTHELRIRITRRFANKSAPWQYVDNVRVSSYSPVLRYDQLRKHRDTGNDPAKLDQAFNLTRRNKQASFGGRS